MYRICSRTTDDGKMLDLFHKKPSQTEISKFQYSWDPEPSGYSNYCKFTFRHGLMIYRITLLQIIKLQNLNWTLDVASFVKPKHCCGSGSS